MDARRRARQVENATNQCDTLALRQDNDAFGEARDCQSCGQTLGQRPGGPMCNWDAFPAGVKFDPTDEELLQHLKAANGVGGAKSHPFIKNFISELEGDEGICQTHPEKLPGVKKDGSSKHFFHRPAKAYTTGTRKRRKISCEEEEAGVETRWHKTGKTRSVSEDGRILGWKKIMVLYRNTGPKKAKSEKTNWILHQYHLGQSEEETDGELVVCKVFYQKQPRQCTGGRSAEGVASEMENVDLNQGSKDASVCVSEVSRGEGVPVTPKVDEQQRLRSSRDAPGNRGAAAVTQSSKGSELTVIGKDSQAAIASELTSTPLSAKNEAIFPGFRAGKRCDAGMGTSSMVNNVHQDATGHYPVVVYEEVTADTSDKPYQVENADSLCRVNGRALDDCQQYLPSLEHDSQQPYLDDKDFPFLNCDEEMDQDFFSSVFNYNCEVGDVEEPYVSNPNEDYPPVDDISLMGSPPAIIQEFMFSSQEAADVLFPIPKPFLDNDDSLSSTQ